MATFIFKESPEIKNKKLENCFLFGNLSCSFDAGFSKIMLVTITNFTFDLCLVIQHEIFNISFVFFVRATEIYLRQAFMISYD